MDRRAREGCLPSVPRSKGCINCVSRKTRCDGRRPTCKACEGRKQQCRGYRRDDFVFMSDGWRAPGVAEAAPRIRRRSCTVESQRTPSPQTPPKDDIPLVVHGGYRDVDTNCNSLVPKRSLTPEPIAIYVSFFLSQFTPDPPQISRVTLQNCRRHIGQLLDRPPPGTRSHPVTDAAEALVKTYFGRIHGSESVVRDSIRSYVRALRSLSRKLDEVQSIGLASLDEEEWMRLGFSCLFLIFWEVSGHTNSSPLRQMVCIIRANVKRKLSMHPGGTTWQKHARGLAKLVEGRGPQGFRSPNSLAFLTSLRMLILLESISSKRRTFLSRRDWRRFRDFRPGLSASAVESIFESVEIGGPKHFMDCIVDDFVTISNLTADFTAALRNAGSSPLNTQSALSEGLEVLQRLERVLAHMQAEIAMFPFGSSSASSTTGGSPFSSSADIALKYNLTSLCRTAAMTLRLLMCDLISQQGGPDRDRSLQEHRATLMVHAEAVLQAIPYSSRSEIFDVAPMCFVPAFRMAEAVLAKESDALLAEVGREGELARVDSMRELVRCHLEFVASKKICVKIDV